MARPCRGRTRTTAWEGRRRAIQHLLEGGLESLLWLRLLGDLTTWIEHPDGQNRTEGRSAGNGPSRSRSRSKSWMTVVEGRRGRRNAGVSWTATPETVGRSSGAEGMRASASQGKVCGAGRYEASASDDVEE
jgi:hypothetical protein